MFQISRWPNFWHKDYNSYTIFICLVQHKLGERELTTCEPFRGHPNEKKKLYPRLRIWLFISKVISIVWRPIWGLPFFIWLRLCFLFLLTSGLSVFGLDDMKIWQKSICRALKRIQITIKSHLGRIWVYVLTAITTNLILSHMDNIKLWIMCTLQHIIWNRYSLQVYMCMENDSKYDYNDITTMQQKSLHR